MLITIADYGVEAWPELNSYEQTVEFGTPISICLHADVQNIYSIDTLAGRSFLVRLQNFQIKTNM